MQNRPSRGGGPAYTGRRVSQLQGKVDIFIKKATNSSLPEVISYEQKSFTDFNLVTQLTTNIQNKGYSEPTPIQAQAIEPILAGRDLIGLANTGTGKTAAFLIPIVNQIFINRNKKALIVTPTRELAQQITDEFHSFTQGIPIYSCLVIGGANIKRQMQDLRRNPHVVIATPGRLKDLVQRRNINIVDFSIFVLDEVDLMVDIGFINDVRFFINLLPAERQSLFFSATISPKVHEVLDAFVKDPITVSVKIQDTAENVDQDVVRVTDRNRKVDQLHQLLIQQEFDKVLIFGRTKHGIDRLNKELQLRGFKVGAIHGNKNQGQRQRILDSFKRHEIQILLATDVASRGLDIPDVSHVINYDLPQTFDDYIHRIGRTGRADKKGVALTFVE
ncbi:DEAD/DEAH box helicase [Candidatus Microgenomates bacterium]|nr:DEAD/DEAH box helicase [Candidatus Microgenomates bacterium]